MCKRKRAVHTECRFKQVEYPPLGYPLGPLEKTSRSSKPSSPASVVTLAIFSGRGPEVDGIPRHPSLDAVAGACGPCGSICSCQRATETICKLTTSSGTYIHVCKFFRCLNTWK